MNLEMCQNKQRKVFDALGVEPYTSPEIGRAKEELRKLEILVSKKRQIINLQEEIYALERGYDYMPVNPPKPVKLGSGKLGDISNYLISFIGFDEQIKAKQLYERVKEKVTLNQVTTFLSTSRKMQRVGRGMYTLTEKENQKKAADSISIFVK